MKKWDFHKVFDDLLPDVEFEISNGSKSKEYSLVINGHLFENYPLIERDQQNQKPAKKETKPKPLKLIKYISEPVQAPSTPPISPEQKSHQNNAFLQRYKSEIMQSASKKDFMEFEMSRDLENIDPNVQEVNWQKELEAPVNGQ